MMRQEEYETRRYVADNMDLVMQSIRRDFGDDGIIFSQREVVEGGIFGFLGTRKVEVIAGRDKKAAALREKKRKQELQASKKKKQISGQEFIEKLMKSKDLESPWKKDLKTGLANSSKNKAGNTNFLREETEALLQEFYGNEQEQLRNNTKSLGNSSYMAGGSSISGNLSGLQAQGVTNLRQSAANIAQSDEYKQLQQDVSSLRSELKDLHSLRSELKDLHKLIAKGEPRFEVSGKLAGNAGDKLVQVGQDDEQDTLKEELKRQKEAQLKEQKKLERLQKDSETTPLENSSPETEKDSADKKRKSELEEVFKALENELQEYEFDKEIIEIYQKVLREEFKDSPAPTLETLKDIVRIKFRHLAASKVRKSVFQELESSSTKKPKIMVFVGPTGVGKTTTIGKIASTLTLQDDPAKKKSIAIITIDTFKVGAVAQIKHYANGLNCEVEVVFKPTEILDAINKHSDKDVILIDTVGRSQNKSFQITDLKGFLPEDLQAETHLCMSATSRYSDMIRTFKAFSKLKVDCLLFTKLDETSCYGPMLSVIQKCTREVSYVTTGQKVPGNYRVIDEEYLSNLMFSDCF